MEEYTLILSDGNRIEHLRLNGNNYISEAELSERDFAGKLKTVTVVHGTDERVMHDVELVQIVKEKLEWWFILRELTPEEKKQRELELTLFDLQAQTDYIAMMTDVEM